MLDKFLNEYNLKLELEMRSIKSLRAIEIDISEKFAGKGYGEGAIISFHINEYKAMLKKLSDISCDLLKNMLNENRTNKIRRTITIDKIKKIILGKIDGTIRQIQESSIPELLAKLNGNLPTGLQLGSKASAMGLISIRNDTERKIEIVINDYNKNPTNFLGRNKDKILVPIIISIITTILTIIVSKLIGLI